MTGGLRIARARVAVGGGSVGVARKGRTRREARKPSEQASRHAVFSSRAGQHGKRGGGGRRTSGSGTGRTMADGHGARERKGRVRAQPSSAR
jgi:hypothetical protein